MKLLKKILEEKQLNFMVELFPGFKILLNNGIVRHQFDVEWVPHVAFFLLDEERSGEVVVTFLIKDYCMPRNTVYFLEIRQFFGKINVVESGNVKIAKYYCQLLENIRN